MGLTIHRDKIAGVLAQGQSQQALVQTSVGVIAASDLKPEGGKVQGGLWVGYPGVDSPLRTDDQPPILQREVIGGREVLLFSVEEANLPGTNRIDSHLGVVARTLPGEGFAFSTQTIDVEEELYEKLGVRPGFFPRMLVSPEDPNIPPAQLLRAMKEQDAEQPDAARLRRWLGYVVQSMTQGAGCGLPEEDQEFARRVYANVLGNSPTLMRQTYTKSQKIEIPALAPKKVTVCVHWVPEAVFEALCAAADRGWSPVLPQWQTIWGYNYNRDWTNPCSNRMALVDQTGRDLSPVEGKFLGPSVAGYTLHVPSLSNKFPYRVPEDWLNLYLAVMGELTQTEAPRNDYPVMEGLLQQAARHIPLMVIGAAGDVGMYRVSAKNTGTQWVIAAERMGVMDYREASVLPGATDPPPVLEREAFGAYVVEKVRGMGATWAEQLGGPR